MKKIVSFSGGRTSAYMCSLMLDLYGKDNVDFVYCDTGAEHPKTYEFIKRCNDYFGLDLVCLRGVFDSPLGKSNSYDIVDVDSLCHDLKPFKGVMKKYSTPYNPGGGMCSPRMKGEIFEKYCNDTYGKGNYEFWLGIRDDEPRRLNTKASKKKPIRYLAEISDFDKQDVIDWWSEKHFDLEIPEHLGNCVFCVKKGINKVALAARDEPELAEQFLMSIYDPSVRQVEGRSSPEIMYRGHHSLDSIIVMFSDHSREDITSTMRSYKKVESGGCTESCEAFGCDIE